jgi:multicomponent Na+:H+ antiporter subunit E
MTTPSPHRAGGVVLFAWLVVIWVGLWGSISIANVASGVLIAAAALVVARWRPASPEPVAFRPWPALRFAVRFVYKLAEASVIVAAEIVTPRNKINTGIVAVPLRGCSDALVTLVANAVSLTPGTLTLEIQREPLVLYVHVLHLRSVEQVRAEVRRLELDAVRAFGSAAALRGLEEDDTRAWELDR